MEPSKELPSVSQWIISLAVSVICCAVLFVIFAGYIFAINDKINSNSARLDAVLERTNLVLSELQKIRVVAVPVPAVPNPAVVDPMAVPSTVDDVPVVIESPSPETQPAPAQ